TPCLTNRYRAREMVMTCNDHCRFALRNYFAAIVALTAVVCAPAFSAQISSIDVPGAIFTEATGITPAGDVVGAYVDVAGAGHGYFTTIDFPGARFTAAAGINPGGAIVGNFTDQSGVLHGFLLRNGRFSAITAPGAIRTALSGINPRDNIVGTYVDSARVHHA